MTKPTMSTRKAFALSALVVLPSCCILLAIAAMFYVFTTGLSLPTKQQIETVMQTQGLTKDPSSNPCVDFPCTAYFNDNGNVDVVFLENGNVGVSITYVTGTYPSEEDVDLAMGIISDLYGDKVAGVVWGRLPRVLGGEPQGLKFINGGVVEMKPYIGNTGQSAVFVLFRH